MPSVKTRINLTVPSDVEKMLEGIAKRDETSVSNAALDLIRRALDIEEDEALLAIAEEREKDGTEFISHEEAWKQAPTA